MNKTITKNLRQVIWDTYLEIAVLVMDKVPTQIGEASSKSEIAIELKEKVLTDENNKKAKKGLKIAAIIFGVIVLIDVISLIIYVSLYGFPQ